MDQRSENKFRKENKMKLLLTSLLSLAFTCLIAADSVKIEFNRKNFDESEKLPKNWGLKGKLFTKKPTYEIVRAENGHSSSINFQPFRILADLAATCFSARHQGKASLRMTCCEQKFNIINHYSHE